jgi:hypothetical protein
MLHYLELHMAFARVRSEPAEEPSRLLEDWRSRSRRSRSPHLIPIRGSCLLGRRGEEGRGEGRRCGTEYTIGVGLIPSMLRAVWDDSCQADLEVFSVRVRPRGVSRGIEESKSSSTTSPICNYANCFSTGKRWIPEHLSCFSAGKRRI